MKEIFGSYSPDQKLADMHMHTSRSDGNMRPYQIVEIAVESNLLDTMAITDHNSIRGSAEAKEHSLKMAYPLDVVVGSEITTSDGHLLGLYLEHDIPSRNSAEWTIKEIHKQGGLAMAPHPLYKRVKSLTENKLCALMLNPDPEVHLDGYEVYNAGVNDRSSTASVQAKEVYLKYNGKFGTPIGSTDGHYFTVGRGLTGYRGELKDAVKSRQTVVLALEEQEVLLVIDIARKLFPKEVESLMPKLERYRELRKRKLEHHL